LLNILKKNKANNNKFSNRSRIHITACILEKCNPKSRKTRIIYKCNLSLLQFNMYAKCLSEGELLRIYTEKNGFEFFETTKEGKRFLDDYRKIRRVLENMRL